MISDFFNSNFRVSTSCYYNSSLHGYEEKRDDGFLFKGGPMVSPITCEQGSKVKIRRALTYTCILLTNNGVKSKKKGSKREQIHITEPVVSEWDMWTAHCILSFSVTSTLTGLRKPKRIYTCGFMDEWGYAKLAFSRCQLKAQASFLDLIRGLSKFLALPD